MLFSILNRIRKTSFKIFGYEYHQKFLLEILYSLMIIRLYDNKTVIPITASLLLFSHLFFLPKRHSRHF